MNDNHSSNVNSSDLDFLWFCHTSNDGEFLGTEELPPRRPTLEYMSCLVETAAELGFSSLLTATNYHAFHDCFTAGVATLARTRGAGLLLAVRTGMFHPAVFAKMAATAQNLFPGRVRVNLVTGSNIAENAMYGDFSDHAARYERTAEFLKIIRLLWHSESPVDFESRFFKIKGAFVAPIPRPEIPIYLSGASSEAQQLAAQFADCYLLWAEEFDMVTERIRTFRELMNTSKRQVNIGLRTHIVVRDTEREAKHAAERIISRISIRVRNAFKNSSRSVDSVGQRAQFAYSGKGLKTGNFYVEPNLWSGFATARTGAGLAVVGDPEQVASKLLAYAQLGVSTFILSGYPHFEECRRFGELVLPRIRYRQPSEHRVSFAEGVAPIA